MGGSWRWVVVWVVVVVGRAAAMSVVNNEEEGRQLSHNIDQDKKVEQVSHRDERLFLIFAKVQPVDCRTNNSIDTTGTCLTSKDCRTRSGEASGTCARGIGVCCIIRRTCNQETSYNNTHFTTPDLTSSTLDGCSLIVNRINDNICQIRLDFLQLDVSPPNENGRCADDFFSVSGGVNSLPKVCGRLTGQHMYYDLDPKGGAVKVTVDRSAVNTASTQWDIRVAQIECDSPYRAPVGCLQYYTEPSNIITSFNYEGTISDTVTNQLADLDYGICIKRADNYCSITWRAYVGNRDREYTFSMSGNAEVVDESLLGTSHASSRGDQCTTDFVVIPGGLYKTEENGDTANHADRYCGLGFPDSVTTYSRPFALYVKTDHNESMDKRNRGFSLSYRQFSCFH